MWDFKFSRRRVWCSELSSGLYCRVKLLSTDVSEVDNKTRSSFIRTTWTGRMLSFSAGHGNHLSTPWKHVGSPRTGAVGTSVLLRTTHTIPLFFTRPFQGLSYTSTSQPLPIYRSLSTTSTIRPLLLAGSQPIVSHHDWPPRQPTPI
jgi:hypothetical protein